MSRWGRFFSRRKRMMEALDEDICDFIERETQDNVERGMPPEEARYAALRKFGNVTRIREETRDVWSFVWLEQLWQDIRFGLRALGRNPGFAAVAVVMLGLGIGATTTILSLTNDFLLRPLPFANSNRLVLVKRYFRDLAQSGTNDPPTFKFWRDQNHVFEDVAAWSVMLDHYNLTGAEGPERVAAKQVSAAFFRVLGVQPLLGRTFSEAEDRQGGNRVALISHALWQGRYGGDRNVLGKTMILDGKDYTVIGVLPAGFRFSTPAEDVWTPLAGYLDGGHGGEFLCVIALLKPHATLAQAQADIAAITTPWARQFPDWGNGNEWVAVESLRDRYAGDLRPALLVLLVAALLVLLIACANVANLLLTRAGSRYKEIAMRRALGAGRIRIMRQMVAESALLALMGGAAGLLLAFAGARAFYAVLPAGWRPITPVGIDLTALALALAALLATVFLTGIAPAWSATAFDLNETLKEGLRDPLARIGRRSFRAMLVTGEVALAATLLTGAILVIKSFARLSAVSLGFDSENVLTVDLARTRTDVNAFYGEVLERVAALPQVRAAGAINFKPLYGGPTWGQDIVIQGRPPRALNDSIYAGHRSVSIGYFRAMGIPLLRGRSFDATDQDKDVAVISQTMARRYWPGEDAVGKRFGVNCSGSRCAWNSVIGVVGDVKEDGATGERATLMYFLEAWPEMTLVVRSDQDAAGLAAKIRTVVHSVDPDQPIGSMQTMNRIESEFVAPRRLTVLIAGIFAAVALILATVGVYGVLSYTVAQRNHEFGIRVALGAEGSDLFNLILKQGLKVAIVGLAIGWAGALALARVLRALLFGVTPTDPTVFLFVALVLMGVALLASCIPARRAAKVDPIVALRCE